MMKRYSQSIFDILQKYPGFIMLIQKNPILAIDDKSAETLYNIWKESTNDQVVLKSDNNIGTLLEKGYIRKNGNGIEITEKGRNLVLEMGLNSPNAFSKDSMPSYSQIKTKASNKRQKVTFTKKASKEDIPVFNLKKERSNDPVNKKQNRARGT